MARKETWVLVADAAGARVLRYAETRRLDLLRTYPHEEARASRATWSSTGPVGALTRAEPVAGMPWSRIRT
jgi:hypothetical protein